MLVAVASSQVPLFEYSALEIKKAVTGYGQAEKDQVQRMVKILLNLEDEHMPFDASDALAIAICHAHDRQSICHANLRGLRLLRSEQERGKG